MILEDIRTYIAQTISEVIYLDFMPPDPDTAICLYSTAGLSPDYKHNYSTPGVQVLVRDNNALIAKELAHNIYSLLHGLGSKQIGNSYIIRFYALQDPYSLGRDANNRAQYVQNFLIEYYDDTQNRV